MAIPADLRPGRALVVNATTGQTAGWAVNDAIRTASRATGTKFEYLLATAKAESDLNPKASSSTSSARGLFQFIDQTWLAMVKEAGPRLGLARYADAITTNASGRYQVSDPAMRSTVMALRNDPTANAVMAGAFTQRNASNLASRLGRPASDGELYIAHFLGSSGAANLIKLAANKPGATAADVFPTAARANRSIFYDSQGQPRTASQVYGNLVGRYDFAHAGTSGAATVADNRPAATRVAAPSEPFDPALFEPQTYLPPPQASAANARVFHGLFQSDPDRPPVSRFIEDLWTSRPHVAAALSGMQAATAAPSRTTGNVDRSDQPLDLFADRPTSVVGLFTGRS